MALAFQFLNVVQRAARPNAWTWTLFTCVAPHQSFRNKFYLSET